MNDFVCGLDPPLTGEEAVVSYQNGTQFRLTTTKPKLASAWLSILRLLTTGAWSRALVASHVEPTGKSTNGGVLGGCLPPPITMC